MMENHESLQKNGQPYMTIEEQPQSRGFRFRYACEGKSHGGLPGENSRKDKKTFPEVRIFNYQGPARITVTLVTDTEVPQPHAHELIGKNCKNGICMVELNGSTQMKYTFSNLGVLHVTKKRVVDILTDRIIESKRLDRAIQNNLAATNVELTMEEKNQARQQAEKQSKNMSLNVVRLCFQGYLKDSNGNYSRLLTSVLSKPIFDCKSPGAAALKICRMDKHAGCCRGQDEVFLLCDKVQKDDIAVRFFEEDHDGQVRWEGFGSFGPADVHRQYAIVFKTPEYNNPYIDKPVSVQVQLKRLSDAETSDPKPFTYYPEPLDQEEVTKKRKKQIFPFGGAGGNFGGGNHGNGGWTTSSTFAQGSSSGENSQHSAGGSINQHSIKMEPMEIKWESFSSQYPFSARGAPRPPPRDSFLPSNVEPDAPRQPTRDSLLSSNVEPDAEQSIKSQRAPVLPPSVDQSKQAKSPPTTSQSEPSSRDEDDAARPSPGGGKRQFSENLLDEKYDSTYGSICESGFQSMRGAETEVVEAEQGEEPTEEEAGSAAGQEEEEEIEVLETNDPESVQGQLQQYRDEVASLRQGTETVMHQLLQLAERSTHALQEYATTGDIEAVLRVYRYLVGTQDDSGDNTLHMAVIHKRPAALRHLLSVLATLPDCQAINMFNDLRQTPLHLAAITNEAEMAELLISQGADFDLHDRHGNTPFHLAAMAGYDRVLAKLLSQPKPGTAWPRPFPHTDGLNFDGFSCVHLAVMQGSVSCLNHLMKVNADVNICDGKSGYTPLHHAVEAENLAIAGHLLLEANAEPNVPCFAGDTPLHLAVGKDHIGMAALLIAAQADPYLENSECIIYSDTDGEEEAGEEDVVVAGKEEITEKEDKQEKSGAEEKEVDEEEEAEAEQGLSPIDMAAGNLRMLKILHGESLSSVQQDSSDSGGTSLPSIYNSGLEMSAGQRREGSSPMVVGELDLLTMSKLSKLLDKEEAWRKVAQGLGLHNLIPALETLNNSPSKALLDSLEALGGSIMSLQSVLERLGRKEAADLLKKYMQAPSSSHNASSKEQ